MGETVADLAPKLGMKELEATLTKYNENRQERRGPHFNRRNGPSPSKRSIYAVPSIPTMYNTQGGPKRNAKCQIVDPFEQPIPRLYSAGEFRLVLGLDVQRRGNNAECLCTGQTPRATPWPLKTARLEPLPSEDSPLHLNSRIGCSRGCCLVIAATARSAERSDSGLRTARTCVLGRSPSNSPRLVLCDGNSAQSRDNGPGPASCPSAPSASREVLRTRPARGFRFRVLPRVRPPGGRPGAARAGIR